jgi:ApaG protein
MALRSPEKAMSTATTRGIRVSVSTRFLPEHSEPRANRFVFAYSIEIVNGSTQTVQLRSRHWHIMHGTGKTEEVKGPGVVGEQPILRPGERFQYSSGCVLTTPHGTMHGTYEMVCEDGRAFDAMIAPFTLAAPHALN